MLERFSKVKVSSVKQAIIAKTPSLVAIKKNYTQERSRAFIVKYIINLASFFNVKQNFSTEQVIETASLIEKYFYYLTMADIRLFTEKMKMQEYGPMYNSFDGGKLIEALKKYDQERSLAYSEIREQQNQKLKRDEKNEAYPDRYIEILKSFLKPKEVKKKDIVISDEQKIFNRWISQFDNLHKKYGKTYGGERFLEIGNYRANINEFLNRKIKNNEAVN